MSTLLQLNPPIELETTKGPAVAYGWIDDGRDSNLVWVCFLKKTRECWSFRNEEVRQAKNWTQGIGREFPLPVGTNDGPGGAHRERASARKRPA